MERGWALLDTVRGCSSPEPASCVCVCVFLGALGKGCGGVQGVSALLIIPASQVSVYCPDSRLRRFACFGAAREIADYEATVKEGVKKNGRKQIETVTDN